MFSPAGYLRFRERFIFRSLNLEPIKNCFIGSGKKICCEAAQNCQLHKVVVAFWFEPGVNIFGNYFCITATNRVVFGSRK